MSKEAQARIKINKLLEEAGWRFLANEEGPANITLETGVSVTQEYMEDAFGEDFEKTSKGYIDYLLHNSDGYPVALLEAKRESIHPLHAKAQARKYAKAEGIQFIILSNGNLHYLWNLEKGNPQTIGHFPTPETLGAIKEFKPDRDKLINEEITEDYIAVSQMPNYRARPEWKDDDQRPEFIEKNQLRFLRYYQVKAIQKIQEAVADGKDRFLFEMATGTGKTLTSAAVIKLFMRTGNARRVLFLVDRIELEDQAHRNFVNYLKNDLNITIFKENRDNWRKAEVVVSTIQSLFIGDKYRNEFDPSDFDLLISDEAHRSIGGNSRAVFEYFHGYKLGLTATPRDYLKGVDTEAEDYLNPREMEIRMLKDTYTTFGCEDGVPTYRYSLVNGVNDGFLVSPTTLDARTEITTQLLSDEGYAVVEVNEDGEEEERTFIHRDFERKFFSRKTNYAFCQSFLENALRDPISGEIGKSLIFCVSQNHARKVTEILNELAEAAYPGKYNSDFAEQVTSLVSDAQQMTINFRNNNLNGQTRWLDGYKSCKTRVCVTVGMMTTGYDCQDVLNVCLMRPIFSPTDFIQMKGRGTRKYHFEYRVKDDMGMEEVLDQDKKSFKLFDFFANCEYFEEEYDYDQKLIVTVPSGEGRENGSSGPPADPYSSVKPDEVISLEEKEIGLEGMRIDREMFRDRFEERMRTDEHIKTQMEAGNWDQIIHYVKTEIFDKPEEYFNMEKLRKAYKVDRKLSIREVIERVFGILPRFKQKDELLEEEFQKFVSIHPPGEKENVTALRHFFKAYIVDQRIRNIVKKKRFQELYSHPALSMEDYKSLTPKSRKVVPKYVDTYVPLDKFAA